MGIKIRLLTLHPYDSATAGNVTLCVSDLGFRTGAGDTPASRYFRPDLSAWSIRRDAWRPSTIGGASLPGRAEFRISVDSEWRRDGRLAKWLSYDWAGWAFTFKELEKGASIATATTIASGTIAGRPALSSAGFTVTAHDRAEDFNSAMQTNVYSGAGGFDGPSELEGVPKPIVAGQVFNCPVTMVDPALLWCDVHDGQIEAISAARDSGVALTPSGSNPPAGGSFYRDLSTGRIRLGTKPAGDVTVDVEGAAPGGSYKATLGQVVRYLVTTFGGLTDPGDLDTAAFTQIDIDRPGTVGYPTLTNEINLGAVLDGLCGGQGVYWYFTRAGKFTLAAFDAPTATAASDSVIARIVRKRDVVEGSAERIEVGVAPWRIVPRYKRRGLVQGVERLASGVSAADRSIYGAQSDGVSGIEDTDIKAANPRSKSMDLTTYLYDRSAASARGTALLSLLDGLRFYRFRTEAGTGEIEIGAELWFEHDELGLGDGIATRVAGVQDDHTGFATVEVAAT